jgi:hypothetical protein
MFLRNLRFKSDLLETNNLKPKEEFRLWYKHIKQLQTAKLKSYL